MLVKNIGSAYWYQKINITKKRNCQASKNRKQLCDTKITAFQVIEMY